jgi:hypothetical protein
MIVRQLIPRRNGASSMCSPIEEDSPLHGLFTTMNGLSGTSQRFVCPFDLSSPRPVVSLFVSLGLRRLRTFAGGLPSRFANLIWFSEQRLEYILFESILLAASCVTLCDFELLLLVCCNFLLFVSCIFGRLSSFPRTSPHFLIPACCCCCSMKIFCANHLLSHGLAQCECATSMELLARAQLSAPVHAFTLSAPLNRKTHKFSIKYCSRLPQRTANAWAGACRCTRDVSRQWQCRWTWRDASGRWV